MSTEHELISVATTEMNQKGGSSTSVQAAIRSRESIFLPASELREYESVLPGAAERLLCAMEKQIDHRISVDNRLLDDGEKQRMLTHGTGILVIFLILITAIIFGLLGMQYPAIAALSFSALSGLASLIKSFNSPKTKNL
ncbi:MAG: DUF2335 domain-containing protein [Planctomycetaceae bacterium]|jgi:uncharacterized membrane protein|nr:DUF2335 domain-containing protein [Planctomycetaceae bacterium]